MFREDDKRAKVEQDFIDSIMESTSDKGTEGGGGPNSSRVLIHKTSSKALMPKLSHLDHKSTRGPKVNIQMGYFEDTKTNTLTDKLPLLGKTLKKGGPLEVSLKLLDALDSNNVTFHAKASKNSHFGKNKLSRISSTC